MRTLLFITLLLCGLARPAYSETAKIKPLFTPLPQSALSKFLRSRPLIIDARMANERVGEFAHYQLNCKGTCSAIKLIPYDIDMGAAGEDLGSFRCQPGQKVLVICLAGVRSTHLANHLIASGRCKASQVTSLKGGLTEKYRLEQPLLREELVQK